MRKGPGWGDPFLFWRNKHQGDDIQSHNSYNNLPQCLLPQQREVRLCLVPRKRTRQHVRVLSVLLCTLWLKPPILGQSTETNGMLDLAEELWETNSAPT